MAIVVASCLVPLRDQHSRASSFETACRKSEGGILSRNSHLSLRPENSSQFLSLSPVFGRATVSLPVSLSSANFLVGISPSLSNLDSHRRLSFYSSPFLNFLAFSMASRTRKTVGKSTAESPGVFRSSLLTKEEEKVVEETIVPEEEGGNGGNNGGGEGGGGGGGGGDGVGWISSALVFGFWAGLILYGGTISPNQTQYQDVYFIEKLLNLHADDGFVMNKVLVAEWWFMGFWPLLYSCLLIPSGRSRKGGVMVGPFLVGSFFVGAFSLLPYFGLWRPPPPVVSKDERSRFPLVILESKITAVVAIVAGLVLAWYAGSAGGDQWTEFIQYVLESRFIHIMTIDFFTLSTLAPFWVYNDLSYRRRSDNISWLLLLTLVPYLGTALYVFLRPPLLSSTTSDESEEISDTREAS